MSDQSTIRRRSRLGHATVVLALVTLVWAVSIFFASAVDVSAMLRPDQAAARAMGPVEIPQEWVWRGRAPINLDSMYGNRKPAQQDWIRTHRSE